MDIFTIAWLVTRLYWLFCLLAGLGLIALAFTVIAYCWRVVYAIAGNIIVTWESWQKHAIALQLDRRKVDVDLETYRRLQELAVTETQKRLVAKIWQDTGKEFRQIAVASNLTERGPR